MTKTEFVEVEPLPIPDNQLAVTYTAAKISDNLAALDAYIDQQLEPYIGAVIDPSDAKMVSEARKCMANLNKLKKPIDDECRRIKSEYEAPLKAFEARVKAITAKIDAARNNLKIQVDKADADFQQARYEALLDEYVAIAGTLADMIPLDALMESKWLTRGMSERAAFGKLADKVKAALDGYNALMEQDLKHKDEVVKRYCDTLDLTAALKYEADLVEADQRLEAFKAAQREVESRRNETPQAEPAPVQEPISDSQPVNQAVEPVCVWELTSTFVGDKTFATRVAETFQALGISGKIKCKGLAQ